MLVRLILLFGVQAVLIQSVLSQCVGRTATAPRVDRPSAINLCATPTPMITSTGPSSCEHSSPAFNTDAVPITSSILPVTSVSAIPLESIAVTSENSYEGSLSVSGELPFLGTVNLDGELPSVGKGAVKHACGGPAKLTKVNFTPGCANTRFNSAPFDAGSKGIRNPNTGENNGVASAACQGRNGYSGVLRNAGAMRFGTSDIGSRGHINTGLGEIVSAKFGANRYSRDSYVAENGGAVFGYNGRGGCLRRTGLGDAVEGFAGYSASGEGDIKVAGHLPVAGETVLVGQVPIAGAVVFQGGVPASGAVSIKGFCSGECDTPY